MAAPINLSGQGYATSGGGTMRFGDVNIAGAGASTGGSSMLQQIIIGVIVAFAVGFIMKRAK